MARHLKGWTLRRARNCRFSAALNVASYARRARASYLQATSAKTANAIGTARGTATARTRPPAAATSIQNISSVLKDLPSPPWYAERAANRPHGPSAGWWSFLAWCRRPKAEPLAALGTHAAKVRIKNPSSV